MEKDKKELSFEEAYKRLEDILEKLSSGKTPLEESISLYEEADKLITTCTKKLTTAERKIQQLVKNREGKLSIDEKGNPELSDYELQTMSLFGRE